MKKKILLRGLLGFPLGIAMGYMISIVISLFWAGGYYSPCAPSLVERMGSEINAVVLQTILCGLLGAAFAASSVIWEMDHWSIAKQMGIYFLITAFVMMPVAYFSNWMEHSLTGFISYFAVFVAIFFIMWLSQYLIWKNKVRKLNEKMR